MSPARMMMILFAAGFARVALAQQTGTATEAFSTDTPTVTVGLPIEVDPTKRSTCSTPTGRGRKLSLALEGMRWGKWPNFCGRLMKYLRPDDHPVNDQLAEISEKLLADTGYFAAVNCTATGTTAENPAATPELRCAMTPASLVREVDVGGSLPFVMIEEDIRRQVFLRPGTELLDEPELAAKQEIRLLEYMEENGYFDSRAKVVLEHSGRNAGPNDGVIVHATVDSGESAPLGEVEIIGPDDLPRGEIEDRLRHYWVLKMLPRQFAPERFNEDLENITRFLQRSGWPEAYVSGEFTHDPARDVVDVTVTVRPGPKVEVRFSGNQFFDNDELQEKVTFTEAGSADAVEIEKTAEMIAQAYQGEGFYRVKVTSSMALAPQGADTASRAATRAATREPREPPERTRVQRIEFEIDEGPRAEVVKVTFTGAESFSQEEIADDVEMKTRESGTFRTGRWMDVNVERDARQIKRFYRLRGFAVTTVGTERRELAPGQLEAIFKIEEGPRRMVSAVSFSGLPPEVKQEELVARMRLVNGKPYVEGRLISDRRELLVQLAAKGYAEAKVGRRLRAPYKNLPGDVTIHYDVDPGERAIFGGFLVRGNFRTSENVIGYELELNPGEPLDLVVLSEAKQRLRALGVFSSVDLRPLDQWLDSKETWLLVDVAERNQLALDLVLSFATDDLFSVGADFRDPNFLGRAIRLNISSRLSNASEAIWDRARIGNVDHLQASVEAPHPLGLPFNVDWSAFYRYKQAQFTERRIGSSAGISRLFLSQTACGICPEVSGRLGYELLATEGDIPRILDEGTIPIARLVPSLNHRRIDSPIDPRSGFSGDIRLELANQYLAGPIRDGANFWRFLVSESVYLNLGTPLRASFSEENAFGGPVVLAVAADYGVVHPYGSLGRVPLSESMYYGGDLSVRGIRERASVYAFPNSRYRFTGNLELRWYFLETSVGAFQLAGITDFGTTSYRMGELFRSRTWTAGGAFRWVTPVGPLSVAYAVPIERPAEFNAHPETAGANGRLHIYFGYTF